MLQLPNVVNEGFRCCVGASFDARLQDLQRHLSNDVWLSLLGPLHDYVVFEVLAIRISPNLLDYYRQHVGERVGVDLLMAVLVEV